MLRDDLDLPEVERAGPGAPLCAAQPAQLGHRHRLLPAGLVHHEVQSQGERSRRPAARLCPDPSLPGRRTPSRATCCCMYELQEMLKEIGGFAGVTLQPSAGAHGELTGVLIMRAYHLDRGDTQRNRDHRPRQRPRHQPGHDHHGRPGGGRGALGRAGQRRPGGPARPSATRRSAG